MGVAVSELVTGDEIALDELEGKVIAVDASLFLYQFLTSIRQSDGAPLRDRKGNVTSHLSGLFFRSAHLMQKGLRLVYVFDGKAPALKEQEREKRAKLKEEAYTRYKEAEKAQDIEGMRKYSSRMSRLTPDMVEESKTLLEAMGIPYVQAPAEGEAQAAYMVSRGDCFGVATQDVDVMMFGAPRVVRNLSILGKRKKANTLNYTRVKPEIVELTSVLNELGIDNDQFIVLCMQVGTDYNVGGIKGIGPKKALNYIKKYGKDFERLFADLGWDNHFSSPWEEVFYLVKRMGVTDDYNLEWKPVNQSRAYELLVETHHFSRERIESTLEKLKETKEERSQKSLFDF